MTIEIPMRLHGIDLREAGAYESIHPEVADLFWMSNGAISLAVVFNDESASAAISEAIGWARRIVKVMPGVSVASVHDELVSISDIATRASVAAEAVRMWTNGKRRSSVRPFPSPRQVIGGSSGGKTMNLYAWREVVTWIREVLGTDPEEGIDYLSDAQLASLNAQLADIIPAQASDSAGAEASDLTTSAPSVPISRLLCTRSRLLPSGAGSNRAHHA